MIEADVDQSVTDIGVEVFIARQPIFERNLKVHGYELLYRGGSDNAFDGTQSDVATARVIANLVLTIGVERLLNGKVAFLNFDATLLALEYAALLPPKSAVVEILETTPLTPEIMASCSVLKQRGHKLALDDASRLEAVEPWLDVVDIVKVDFRGTDEQTRASILESCKRRKIRTVASKVESQEQFELAAKAGYDYVQGFFFAEPTIFKGRAIPENKILLLELLREVSREEVDFDKVEKLLQRNAALVYNLLRYVNSPLFGWTTKIKSLSHAMALIGQEELRKWICLLLVARLGQDAPPELIVKSLMRARFAELISSKIRLNGRESSAFLLGLLSHLDALLHCPMEEALAGLQLQEELVNALLGRSQLSDKLGLLYHLLQAYETGDRVRTFTIAEELGMPVGDLGDLYINAATWADQASVA